MKIDIIICPPRSKGEQIASILTHATSQPFWGNSARDLEKAMAQVSTIPKGKRAKPRRRHY